VVTPQHHRIGEAVEDLQPLLPVGHEVHALEHLEVAGRVGDRQAVSREMASTLRSPWASRSMISMRLGLANAPAIWANWVKTASLNSRRAWSPQLFNRIIDNEHAVKGQGTTVDDSHACIDSPTSLADTQHQAARPTCGLLSRPALRPGCHP